MKREKEKNVYPICTYGHKNIKFILAPSSPSQHYKEKFRNNFTHVVVLLIAGKIMLELLRARPEPLDMLTQTMLTYRLLR